MEVGIAKRSCQHIFPTFDTFRSFLLATAQLSTGSNNAVLEKFVKRLPQELWNRIYDHVFSAREEVIHIDKTCVTPRLLQIDQASRTQFAISYYMNTTFIFTSRYTLHKWLSHKTSEERDLIDNTMYLMFPPFLAPTSLEHDTFWKDMEELNRSRLEGRLNVRCIDVVIRLHRENSSIVSSNFSHPSSEGVLTECPRVQSSSTKQSNMRLKRGYL